MSCRSTRGARPRRGAGAVLRSPRTRVTALVAVVGLVGGYVVAGAGGGAGAVTQYTSRSVGNFLDGSVGGVPLDQVAALDYAHADDPGTTSTQNPLDATALDAVELPLTNAIKLPSFAGIDLGAVNQVATASSDGSSLGASGAVDNSGGVSVGGDDDAYPSSATIDLGAAGLSGTSPIPIPGGSSASSLADVAVSVHGVSGVASTDDTATAVTPTYTIADLDLTLGSPALGALLSQLTTALNDNPLSTTLNGILTSVLSGLPLLGALPTLPAACTLTPEGLGRTLSLEGGAVTIDASSGSIAISVRALLGQLGLDLDALPANTDLTEYVLDYLTSPDGLAAGLEGLVDGLVDGLENQLSGCSTALAKLDPTHLLGTLVSQLTTALDNGRTQLESIVNDLLGSVSGLGGTGNPLSAIGDALGKIVDVGVNVQNGPGAAASNGDDRFTSALENTPKQGTDVVTGQTLVRAVEIDLLAVDTTASAAGARPHAATGTSGVVLALGNAAAGPSAKITTTPSITPSTSTTPTTSAPSTSTPVATPSTSTSTSTPLVTISSDVPGGSVPTFGYPSTAVPNAVPAGAAGHPTSGSALPLTIVLLGLLAGSAAVFGLRRRLTRTDR